MVGDHDLYPIVTKFKGCYVNYSSVSEFKKYFKDERLSSEKYGAGWVFSTRERDDDRSIKEQIRSFLIWVTCHHYNIVFVQFWAPKQVGKRSILTTSGQPFAVCYCLCNGISSYRKKCMEYHYIVGDGAEKEQFGPPGRVFRNGRPESSPNVHLYSAKEFPLRDHAASCGLEFYIALPIFDSHYSRCVGVLEFVGYKHAAYSRLHCLLKCIYDALKAVGMRTTPMIDMQLRINLWESISDDHQWQVNDREKMLDLILIEYDKRHSISESRENLQKPEMDNTKNVEEQEHKDLGKSRPGNHQLQVSDILEMIDLTLMDSDDEGYSISESRKNSQKHEIGSTKMLRSKNKILLTQTLAKGRRDTRKQTSFHISYEDLEPHFGKTLEGAANELGVSRSTLKRARKDCGITRWPSNVKNKKNPPLFQTKTCNKPVQNPNQQIFRPSGSSHLISDGPLDLNVLYSCTESTGEVDITCRETNVVTIKAKFKEDIIKFDMCLSSGLKKLMCEVAKRLNFMIVDFKLKYKDDDDDLISLTCDEDLHYYVKRMKSLSKTTIQVLVHLVSN